jgi:putative transposase
LRRNSKRPRLRHLDRAFWLLLSRIWSRFADGLVIVKPDTIVRWHRRGFRLFSRWKSRLRKPRKGQITPEIKKLVRRMAESNVGWGAPKIHGELLRLGFEINERCAGRWNAFCTIESWSSSARITTWRRPGS